MRVVLVREGLTPLEALRFADGAMETPEDALSLVASYDDTEYGAGTVIHVEWDYDLDTGQVRSAKQAGYEAVVLSPETRYEPQEPLWLLYGYAEGGQAYYELTTDEERAERWENDPVESSSRAGWEPEEGRTWTLPVKG